MLKKWKREKNHLKKILQNTSKLRLEKKQQNLENASSNKPIINNQLINPLEIEAKE